LSIMGAKLRLPTGREAAIVEGLRFCYDLSETDVAILFELLQGGDYTVDDLTQKLGLSKATINRGLAKLVEVGFVSRKREKRARVGRPRYKYYIDNPERVVEKIISDFEECARTFRRALENIVREVAGGRGGEA